MATRDVLEIRDELYKDLQEANDVVHQFESVAVKNVLSPDAIKEAEDIIEIVKSNYQSISYFIFLMHENINAPEKYMNSLKDLATDFYDSWSELKEMNDNSVAGMMSNMYQSYSLYKENYQKNSYFLYLLYGPKRKKNWTKYITQLPHFKRNNDFGVWNIFAIHRQNCRAINELRLKVKEYE